MFTAEQVSREKIKIFDSSPSKERVEMLTGASAEKFRMLMGITQRFHISFLALFGCGLCALLVLSFFSKSLFIAICLAGLCLTSFSYFLIRFYLEAKKPQLLTEILNGFVQGCQETFGGNDPLAIAHALQQLALCLSIPKGSQPLLEKANIWMHWKEVHEMKEILLHEAISYQIEMVKLEPLDLQTHASLAHTHLALADLYRPAKEWIWIPSAYKQMEDLRNQATKSAIQEFKILDSLAPSDPWVHAELARIYAGLGLVEKEIEEYEMLIKISPQDFQLHFRLGVLYFEQKESAKALHLYQQLKAAGDRRAAALISYYQ